MFVQCKPNDKEINNIPNGCFVKNKINLISLLNKYPQIQIDKEIGITCIDKDNTKTILRNKHYIDSETGIEYLLIRYNNLNYDNINSNVHNYDIGLWRSVGFVKDDKSKYGWSLKWYSPSKSYNINNLSKFKQNSVKII